MGLRPCRAAVAQPAPCRLPAAARGARRGKTGRPSSRLALGLLRRSCRLVPGSFLSTCNNTQGGVAINSEAQALDANGVPIPGLFAAGEVAGEAMCVCRLSAAHSCWLGLRFCRPGVSQSGRQAGRQAALSIRCCRACCRASPLFRPLPAARRRRARRKPAGWQLAARVCGVWAARGAQRCSFCAGPAA